MFTPISLKSIADLVKGKLIGNPDLLIHGINTLELAKKDEITFIYQNSYSSKLVNSAASAFIFQEDIEIPSNENKNLIIVKNARLSFNELVEFLLPPKKENRQISSKSYVSETAKTGNNVTIYPQAYIGNRTIIGDNVTIYPGVYIGDDVTVGENTLIYANCSIYDRCKIGKNCIIGANTVIGSDGFGYIQTGKEHRKIHHVGYVEICDEVEIGACCAIDRATYSVTKIGKGTKLDDLVQIAHNSQVGEYNIICGQSGTAGSSKTGNDCIMLGRSGVGPQVTMHDNTLLFQSSILLHDNDKGGEWRGEIARPHKEYIKANAGIYYIGKLRDRVKKLEQKLEQLTDQKGT